MFYECNCDGYSTPPATTKYDGKELWALGSLKSKGFRLYTAKYFQDPDAMEQTL